VLGQYDGTLYGTGYNNHGQLGISTADQSPATQSNIFQPILSDVKFADGGAYHTSAVKKDGSVWGAGYNLHGELGDGTKTSRKEFVKSNIESGAVYVSAGFHHTMVLKDDGSLWGTGHNTYGTLGDGTNVHKTSFVKVIDGGVADVDVGRFHTMVVKTDGSLWGTGYDLNGQLGFHLQAGHAGRYKDKNTFVKVIDECVMDVSAGHDFTYVVKSDGSMWATGLEVFGSHGDGTKNNNKKSHFAKVVDSGVKAVTAGWMTGLFLKTDGSVWGAGLNDKGQLGDGTRTDKIVEFVKIVDGGVKEVATGQYFSVLLNDKNELCVTGQNNNGMLGTGDKTDVVGFDKKCFPRPGPCYANNGGCHSKRTCIADNKGSVSCGDCPAPLTNGGPKGCKG
jgi:alpha-tubulin suppressor-like RCC1 family protein